MMAPRLNRFVVAALVLHALLLGVGLVVNDRSEHAYEQIVERAPHEMETDEAQTEEMEVGFVEVRSPTSHERAVPSSQPNHIPMQGIGMNRSPASAPDPAGQRTAVDGDTLATGLLGANEARAAAPESASTDPTPTLPHTPPKDGRDDSRAPLSLTDMGIGKPTPFALVPEQTDRLAYAEDRLERSMAQATLDEDRSMGLGSHALVTGAVNQAATGLAPPRSKARLSVLADAEGRITAVDVMEVNRDFDTWRRVAERALTAMLGKRLTHQLGRPTRMIFEVESKVQLPSGRGPGTNVTVLGIPIEDTGDETSTHVKVLSPEVELEMVEVLDPTSSGGETIKMPAINIQMTVLGVNGDLVDVGANARQVVHTRLVNQEVL